MRKELFVFTTILLLAGMHSPAQNPYIHHYTTFDGLPCNSINNIFQDSQKFIWFATDAGAVMYDGSTFTTFTKKDGLNSNKITKIKEDSFGRVWIINYEGSLNFYYHNKIYNTSNAAFLDSLRPSETFHDFFQDDDKTIYFHNPMYEVYILDSNNHVKNIEKLSEYLIENLVNKEGNKAIGPYPKNYTSSFPDFILANLYKIRKKASGEYLFWSRWGLFQVKELFKDPLLLHYNYRSYMRASCSRGEYFYILAFTQYIKKFKDDYSDELIRLPSSVYLWYTMSRQNALLVDNNGYYWVGTFDDGLYCFKEDSIVQPKSEPNVPQIKSSKIIQHLDIRQVNGLIQDHEGNIWVSSSEEGVYKISPYLNTHRHFENKLFQNKGIKEMAQGLWNGMWLSNGRTIYFLMADSLYTLGFQEPNTSFNSIYHLKTNKLIIGEKYSYYYSLHNIKPDPVKKKVNFSSADTSILYMSGITVNEKEDKINCFNYFNFDLIDPDTLFGQYQSGVWQKDYNVGSRITNTYYNSKDELIANAKKNYIQVNDTFLYASELSRFDNRIITQHLNLNSQTELFNIENDSLYLFQDHEFYDLTTAFATPASLNISNISYHEPALYMANSSNIYICDNPLNVIENKPVNLQLIDINFKNIRKILLCNDSLYIASDDGLTVIPEEVVNDIVPQRPLPYIQSVLVNDIQFDFTENKLNLKGRKSLKFMFSSISYSSTPVIYSYLLEGADKEWSSGTGNIVAYQELPFGKYVFKLKVGKPNTAWSDVLAFDIIIKPEFWQHPAFITIVILLIMASIVLVIIRIANNKIKRRETDHQLIVLEQKALQSMMNPHFIFNSLGSIQNYLLKNKPGEAGLYLSQFARLIRQNISGIHSAMISLDEEIDRLKNYLDLERLRMENKFEYQFHLDESVEEDAVKIPSMIIQPFVENAILHGVSSLEKDGLIGISFAMASEKTIKITVEDNGIGIKQSKVYNTNNQTHLHLSMEMTRKRIIILGKKFKVETSLEISDLSPGSPNPGTRVVIVLPVSYGEDSVDS
ncbi:MAG: histidine kinase [Bacteroidales bacterium]|nr:histidine kinase [Bacteroidales bacterium]